MYECLNPVFKINDLLSYSSSLYQDQGHSFVNKDLHKELSNFLKDRFRYYLKEKQIRLDIIESLMSSLSLNKLSSSFEKAKSLNKVISNQIGTDIISSYKRASNILEVEMKNNKIEISNTTDPGILKVIMKKIYSKRLMKLENTTQGLIMTKITNNHC